MTEEKINAVDEKKECNCPICKVLRSDCTKKFLLVVLASFIGCSLALLAFTPKKHYPIPRYQNAPYMQMIDRPMPPAPEFKRFEHAKGHHFRGDHYRYPTFQDRGPHKKHFRDGAPHHKRFHNTPHKFPTQGEYKGKINGKLPCNNKNFNAQGKPQKPVTPTPEPTKTK